MERFHIATIALQGLRDSASRYRLHGMGETKKLRKIALAEFNL
jgi:hypothetical protein